MVENQFHLISLIEKCSFVDLTHDLDEGIPTWNGSCGFKKEVKMDYDQGVRVLSYKSHAGIGTHMDAPSHFIRGGKNISDIALEELIVPLCVLDMSKERNPDLLISPEDVLQFEKKFGAIPPKSLVLANTGWEKYWSNTVKYRNADAKGKMHFPGFMAKTAELLLQRKISGIGIDTLSPDGSTDKEGFPVHELILGAGKYILENLCNLGNLPPQGALALVMPMKVVGGAESAIRLVALAEPENGS